MSNQIYFKFIGKDHAVEGFLWFKLLLDELVASLFIIMKPVIGISKISEPGNSGIQGFLFLGGPEGGGSNQFLKIKIFPYSKVMSVSRIKNPAFPMLPNPGPWFRTTFFIPYHQDGTIITQVLVNISFIKDFKFWNIFQNGMVDLLLYMPGSKPTFSMTVELSANKFNEFWIVMRTSTAVVQCNQSTPFSNEINQ